MAPKPLGRQGHHRKPPLHLGWRKICDERPMQILQNRNQLLFGKEYFSVPTRTPEKKYFSDLVDDFQREP
jgi:hypothetical protein